MSTLSVSQILASSGPPLQAAQSGPLSVSDVLSKPQEQSQQEQKPLSPAEIGSVAASVPVAAAGVSPNPLTIGAAKGVGETAHTIGRLINAATGDNISWLPKSMKQPGELESSNAGESVGKIGESIAEFALGDEALKGLSIAEKLGVAQKIHELAQQSPTLAKLITYGLNVVRGGATGAAAGGLHEGVQGAETGAALGAGAEAVAPVAGAVIKAAKESPGVVQKILKGEKSVQPEVAETMRSVGNTQEGSLREVLSKPIADADAEKRALYKAYDDAAGVDRKALEDRLSNTQEAMSRLTGTPGDAKRLARLQAAEASLKETIATADEKAAAQGVHIADADAANVRLRAMQDAEKNVFKNQAVVTGNTAQGGAEEVNVDEAIKAIQKMKDNEKFGGPRWDQAFGEGSADRVLTNLRRLQAQGVRASNLKKLVQWAGGIAIGGSILGAVSHATGAVKGAE